MNNSVKPYLLSLLAIGLMASLLVVGCNKNKEATTSETPPVVSNAAPVNAQPWIASPESVAAGKTLFEANCVACHGPKGLGDGPSAAALSSKPRNLVEGKWKKGGSTIALFHTITAGLDGTSMASFSFLNDQERWALAQFLHSISKNAPEVTEAEIETLTSGS